LLKWYYSNILRAELRPQIKAIHSIQQAEASIDQGIKLALKRSFISFDKFLLSRQGYLRQMFITKTPGINMV
jgi:hypothetical protein